MNTSREAARDTAKMIQRQHALRDEVDHLDYVEYLVALRGELEDQIAGSVAVARAQGAEWQHIANALGVTKQAAHKRYA